MQFQPIAYGKKFSSTSRRTANSPDRGCMSAANSGKNKENSGRINISVTRPPPLARTPDEYVIGRS